VHALGRDHAVLAPIARRLAGALRALPDPALPIHFDYATADVLVPPDGPTTVVDFDDAAMGDPAFDVANFGATLMLRGWRRAADSGTFAEAAAAFEAGYREHAPLPPIAPAIEAAVWLRLAHRCLERRVGEELWRFALERAGEGLAREDGR
jgi:Ser/Thr protein kinase RdoA (MazF antagonist)